MFSLLPGIGRARYCWLYIVVDQIFTSGGVDLRAYSSIHSSLLRKLFFFFFNFVAGFDRETILTFPDLWYLPVCTN